MSDRIKFKRTKNSSPAVNSGINVSIFA